MIIVEYSAEMEITISFPSKMYFSCCCYRGQENELSYMVQKYFAGTKECGANISEGHISLPLAVTLKKTSQMTFSF